MKTTEKVRNALGRGDRFPAEVAESTGLTETEVADALAELVAAGIAVESYRGVKYGHPVAYLPLVDANGKRYA